VTGKILVVSDLGNPAQGNSATEITDLAIGDADNILISVQLPEANPNLDHSAILQVNPNTGDRTVISDFLNPAQGKDVVDLMFSAGLADRPYDRAVQSDVHANAGSHDHTYTDPYNDAHTVQNPDSNRDTWPAPGLTDHLEHPGDNLCGRQLQYRWHGLHTGFSG